MSASVSATRPSSYLEELIQVGMGGQRRPHVASARESVRPLALTPFSVFTPRSISTLSLPSYGTRNAQLDQTTARIASSTLSFAPFASTYKTVEQNSRAAERYRKTHPYDPYDDPSYTAGPYFPAKETILTHLRQDPRVSSLHHYNPEILENVATEFKGRNMQQNVDAVFMHRHLDYSLQEQVGNSAPVVAELLKTSIREFRDRYKESRECRETVEVSEEDKRLAAELKKLVGALSQDAPMPSRV